MVTDCAHRPAYQAGSEWMRQIIHPQISRVETSTWSTTLCIVSAVLPRNCQTWLIKFRYNSMRPSLLAPVLHPFRRALDIKYCRWAGTSDLQPGLDNLKPMLPWKLPSIYVQYSIHSQKQLHTPPLGNLRPLAAPNRR